MNKDIFKHGNDFIVSEDYIEYPILIDSRYKLFITENEIKDAKDGSGDGILTLTYILVDSKTNATVDDSHGAYHQAKTIVDQLLNGFLEELKEKAKSK